MVGVVAVVVGPGGHTEGVVAGVVERWSGWCQWWWLVVGVVGGTEAKLKPRPGCAPPRRQWAVWGHRWPPPMAPNRPLPPGRRAAGAPCRRRRPLPPEDRNGQVKESVTKTPTATGWLRFATQRKRDETDF